MLFMQRKQHASESLCTIHTDLHPSPQYKLRTPLHIVKLEPPTSTVFPPTPSQTPGPSQNASHIKDETLSDLENDVDIPNDEDHNTTPTPQKRSTKNVTKKGALKKKKKKTKKAISTKKKKS